MYRSWVGIFSLAPLFFQRFLKHRKFCDFCARSDFLPGILSEHKLDPLKRARKYSFSFSRSKAPLVLTRSCLLKQQNKFCIGDIINWSLHWISGGVNSESFGARPRFLSKTSVCYSRSILRPPSGPIIASNWLVPSTIPCSPRKVHHFVL